MIRNFLLTAFLLSFALVAQAGGINPAKQGWGDACFLGPVLGQEEKEDEKEKKKEGEEEEPDCE